MHDFTIDASALIDSDEVVLDIRFGCENHTQPGECSEECTHLIAAMSGGPAGVDFDPTGCSYPAPRERTTFAYDPARRASVIVTVSPITLLSDADYERLVGPLPS